MNHQTLNSTPYGVVLTPFGAINSDYRATLTSCPNLSNGKLSIIADYRQFQKPPRKQGATKQARSNRMITHKCEECESIFDFEKKDFKEHIFAKKEETFIVTKRLATKVKLFRNSVTYSKITFRLIKDLKLKGIKCPICENIDWKVKELISNPTSIKSDGWYILKYAPELIKVEQVKRENSVYEISKREAEENRIGDCVDEYYERVKDDGGF